jgi:hypothetical protein
MGTKPTREEPGEGYRNASASLAIACNMISDDLALQQRVIESESAHEQFCLRVIAAVEARRGVSRVLTHL